METARLISHKDTALVTYEQLREIVTPNSSRYWKPVAHVELVDTLRVNLANRGLEVERQQFAIGSNGLKLFGTFDLVKPVQAGIGLAMGFRHSNDKRIALQIVGGARVFVCDNMAFSGDAVILKQKHTWGFSLRDMINRGLDMWQGRQRKFEANIERMQNTPLTDEQARALLGKALYEGITTFQTFKLAYELYFERAVRIPEQYPDCAPRTAWGLHNAYTRALKESTPNVAFNTTVAIAKVFEL